MSLFDNASYKKEPTVKKRPGYKIKSYPDWKKKILEDLNRHIEIVSGKSKIKEKESTKEKGSTKKKGSTKADHAFIMNLSSVSDDYSIVELTLRYGNDRLPFDDSGNKAVQFTVPDKTKDGAHEIRLAALAELCKKIESDDYKSQITDHCSNKAKKMRENRKKVTA